MREAGAFHTDGLPSDSPGPGGAARLAHVQEIAMNIREKLQELSIYVPEAAQRCRAGKGCLVWLPAEAEDGSPALFLMPVTREQYEGLMAAGLLGPNGWHVEQPYVDPRAR